MSDIVDSWTVTGHGVAEPAEVERAIVLLGADDATLAYRVQGYIAAREAEITRLRSLVEEAGKVVERCQAVLAIMIKPDMTVSSMNAYTLCVEAEARSRSLLTKLKPEPQALSKAE